MGNAKGIAVNRRIVFLIVLLCTAVGFSVLLLRAQGQQPQQFPLAAPAGKDSGAITTAPAVGPSRSIAVVLVAWPARLTSRRSMPPASPVKALG